MGAGGVALIENAEQPLAPPTLAVLMLLIVNGVVLPVFTIDTLSLAGDTATVVGVGGGPALPGVIVPVNGVNVPETVNTGPAGGEMRMPFASVVVHPVVGVLKPTSKSVGCGAEVPVTEVHAFVVSFKTEAGGTTTVNVVVPSGFCVEPVTAAGMPAIVNCGNPTALATTIVVVPPACAGATLRMLGLSTW